MTSQFELLPFIRTKKVVTYREIMTEFKMDYPSVLRKVKAMNKMGIVEIEVEDGQKHLISISDKPTKIKEVKPKWEK